LIIHIEQRANGLNNRQTICFG